jgi:hypothetical protein
MSPETLLGISTVPAIVGIVQVLKDLGLPSRAAPAASVALGVLAELGQLYYHRWSWIPAVAAGLALGLSAAGLYAGAKATFSSQEVQLQEQLTGYPDIGTLKHPVTNPPARNVAPDPAIPWADERTTS